MKKLYFSKIKFINPAGQTLTESELNILKKASEDFMDFKLEFPVPKDILENRIKVGTEITLYSPAGVKPAENGLGCFGSIIKGAKITRNFYDRNRPEEITSKRDDTEYKINFYYDSVTQIVGFQKTNAFGELQFNNAFADLMAQSIRKNLSDKEKEVPDFIIVIDFIKFELNTLSIINEIKKIGKIAKLEFAYKTIDTSIQFDDLLKNSRTNCYTTSFYSEDSKGLNLDNPQIIKQLNSLQKYFLSLKDEDNDFKIKTSIELTIEDTKGNVYNTVDKKYKSSIEENLNEHDFNMVVLGKIRSII